MKQENINKERNNADSPIIEISNLKTYFFTEEGTVRAVDGVDLRIYRGEVLGLVGESGCGKSTVALSILGLVPKPGKTLSGNIIFEGNELQDLDDNVFREIRGSIISIIWQDPMSSLNPVFTVGSQVSEVIKIHQGFQSDQEILERTIELFEKVEIPDAERRINDYPHEFSGGMRQRVMIAMALSCNPKLLIADEPTTSLDVTIQAQILDLMRQMKKDFDSAILLITHDLGVVAEMADKVAVMYAGKIVEYSDVLTIFKKPLHPYTEALLESVPRVDKMQEKLTPILGTVPNLVDIAPGCRFEPRCRRAIDICVKEEPSAFEVEPGHVVSCHLVRKKI